MAESHPRNERLHTEKPLLINEEDEDDARSSDSMSGRESVKINEQAHNLGGSPLKLRHIKLEDI
jgi:hypothetical protein